ncbi:MAG TPA: DUF1998 domain-containing protein [Blastocatellia bacterium]
MSAAAGQKRKVGDLRPTQLLYTFGVGSMIELPNMSVMVMGLDDWPAEQAVPINEPRLLKAVQKELGTQVAKLVTPPVAPESGAIQGGPFDDLANVGVPVAPFPRWLLCPYCRLLAPVHSGLFELKLDLYRKDRCRYVHRICKKPGKPPTAVPARFLTACEKGHLDDFPWVRFVHKMRDDCRYELRLYELGASGEVSDIEVRCVTCGKPRRMSDAFDSVSWGPLAECRGRWPHLRKFDETKCKEFAKTILLGASNSWFPITLSTLSIPATTDKLGQLIDLNWVELDECESAREVKLKRRLVRGLAAYTDDQIWEAVAKKKEGGEGLEDDSQDLRGPEWDVFSNPDPQLTSRDFKLRPANAPKGFEKFFDKVVLVDRVREVRSLVSFTRIESPGDYSELADFPPDRRVPISRADPAWVPTCEIRGEGVFLEFSEPLIDEWKKKVPGLAGRFLDAHKSWRSSRGLDPDIGFPGIKYVLLHSLAHVLIRQFSLECGYAAASIRERIYSHTDSGDEASMAGVLLYTAAPDSEGTLGGLVSLGEPGTLGRMLDQALEAARLCSSDPLCAEHPPFHDGLTLHGAACHACMYLPETSCERGNRYLDRSVLVHTWGDRKSGFFEE